MDSLYRPPSQDVPFLPGICAQTATTLKSPPAAGRRGQAARCPHPAGPLHEVHGAVGVLVRPRVEAEGAVLAQGGPLSLQARLGGEGRGQGDRRRTEVTVSKGQHGAGDWEGDGWARAARTWAKLMEKQSRKVSGAFMRQASVSSPRNRRDAAASGIRHRRRRRRRHRRLRCVRYFGFQARCVGWRSSRRAPCHVCIQAVLGCPCARSHPSDRTRCGHNDVILLMFLGWVLLTAVLFGAGVGFPMLWSPCGGIAHRVIGWAVGPLAFVLGSAGVVLAVAFGNKCEEQYVVVMSWINVGAWFGLWVGQRLVLQCCARAEEPVKEREGVESEGGKAEAGVEKEGEGDAPVEQHQHSGHARSKARSRSRSHSGSGDSSASEKEDENPPLNPVAARSPSRVEGLALQDVVSHSETRVKKAGTSTIGSAKGGDSGDRRGEIAQAGAAYPWNTGRGASPRVAGSPSPWFLTGGHMTDQEAHLISDVSDSDREASPSSSRSAVRAHDTSTPSSKSVRIDPNVTVYDSDHTWSRGVRTPVLVSVAGQNYPVLLPPIRPRTQRTRRRSSRGGTPTRRRRRRSLSSNLRLRW